MDVDAPAPSASVGAEGVGGSLGGLNAPSVEGGVSAELPSAGGGLSGSMPDVAGDVSIPSGSIDVGVPSGSVDVPSTTSMVVAGAAPGMPAVEGGISGELPSVDAKLETPSVSVSASGTSLSADLPSASVDASGSVPTTSGGGVHVCAPSVSSAAVEGVTGAVVDLSADVGAKVDDVDVAVRGPDVPSGEWKKPKKSLFSMFGSGKGKMEVRSLLYIRKLFFKERQLL